MEWAAVLVLFAGLVLMPVTAVLVGDGAVWPLTTGQMRGPTLQELEDWEHDWECALEYARYWISDEPTCYWLAVEQADNMRMLRRECGWAGGAKTGA